MKNLYDKLQEAGLPVISVTDDGNIQMGGMSPEQEEDFKMIVLEHVNPALHAEYIEERTARENMKTEYGNAVTTLSKIENAGNMTNAQVVAAIKYMAKIVLFLLKTTAKKYEK